MNSNPFPLSLCLARSPIKDITTIPASEGSVLSVSWTSDGQTPSPAIEGFKTAQKWNPSLFPASFDPVIRAKQLAEAAKPKS